MNNFHWCLHDILKGCAVLGTLFAFEAIWAGCLVLVARKTKGVGE